MAWFYNSGHMSFPLITRSPPLRGSEPVNHAPLFPHRSISLKQMVHRLIVSPRRRLYLFTQLQQHDFPQRTHAIRFAPLSKILAQTTQHDLPSPEGDFSSHCFFSSQTLIRSLRSKSSAFKTTCLITLISSRDILAAFSSPFVEALLNFGAFVLQPMNVRLWMTSSSSVGLHVRDSCRTTGVFAFCIGLVLKRQLGQPKEKIYLISHL